jgi:hypothetical protein
MPAISSWPLLVKKHSKNDEYSLCILIITTKKAPIYGRHLLRNDVILLSVTSKRHDCYAYLHSLLNLAVLPNYSHTQTLPLLFQSSLHVTKTIAYIILLFQIIGYLPFIHMFSPNMTKNLWSSYYIHFTSPSSGIRH